MKRRELLALGGAGIAGSIVTGSGQAQAQQSSGTAFVLVHGSWHGGWCWGLVEPILNNAGHATIAIDLPGHGLNASLPASFLTRPLDTAAFAAEPSGLAAFSIDAFADAVIEGADRARAEGAKRVVAVGHSMGGVPITFAAAKAPEKFDGLVYLAALAPTPGKPAGAYLELEDQHTNSKLGPVIMADPAKIGALRIDPRSPDAAYQAAAKEALAADVDDRLLATVMHLLTPDAPAAMYGEAATFADGFEGIQRTFIRCTEDRTLVPSTCDVIVADMNAAWPGSPTRLIDMQSSHEAMFGQPETLAKHLMELS
jgi:pimeloyl-ACP methyl ester carboxylesterase